jgi:hypothetical protein
MGGARQTDRYQGKKMIYGYSVAKMHEGSDIYKLYSEIANGETVRNALLSA